MNKIAITTGDPNGIGAEITIKALNKLDLPADKIVLISNKRVLDFYGKQQYCHPEFADLRTDGANASPDSEQIERNARMCKERNSVSVEQIQDVSGSINVDSYKKYELIEIPYDAEIEPGKISAQAGEFSYSSVKKACEIGAKAIVTAPVAKNALYMAGHKFNGQTEILQKYLAHGAQLAEMLFVAGGFRVLLLTRHVALKEINLTREMVVEKVSNLKDFFASHLGIKEPKFALCAFNPHAGEDGILGREEIEILQPAVEELRAKGINITNPLPADTLFVKALNFDCCIANYHDQGLIPIKTVAGDKTVNMTIGLDIIRTSPGHGTAFDIAGKNIADETGMIEAIKAVM